MYGIRNEFSTIFTARKKAMMKKKGYAKGAMMKKKGMAKGGMKKMARGGFLAPAARPIKKRTKGGARGGKK